jgi:hypothetical protein
LPFITSQVNQCQLKSIWSNFRIKPERANQQLNFVLYLLEISTSSRELFMKFTKKITELISCIIICVILYSRNMSKFTFINLFGNKCSHEECGHLDGNAVRT